MQVYGRNTSHAKTLAKKLGADFTSDLKEINQQAEIYILAVTDSSIHIILKELELKKQLVWKSTRGPRHGGGMFDYGYFTTDYLAEATHLFDLLPRHLIAGGGSSRPMTTMTCHGYHYIYEMQDFARKYYSTESDDRAWFGYLHGQALNVFGPATTDFAAGITLHKLRTNDLAGEQRRKVPAHGTVRRYEAQRSSRV